MRGQVRFTLLALVALCLTGGGAYAQVVDLSGVWFPLRGHEDQPERGAGPPVGDFLGMPLTEAGRMRAETWNTAILTIPEHQCKPHPAIYGLRGIGSARIWSEVDDITQKLIRIRLQIEWMEQKRDIWMDGRPHPPEYAAHTWQGFSTGRFVGNQLVVKTTHMKVHWARRNGVFLTDKATMEERFIRHGDHMTNVQIVSDPYYFTEPLIRTSDFRLTDIPIGPYPCDAVVEVVRDRGIVPNYLPRDKHTLAEFAAKFNIPYEATRGGAYTALPEFGRQLASQRPAAATSNQ